ncbi:MAG: hypothetical protein H7338_16610 [Candidatus Sericytochromatia bacterium]|nr:hypothetical protein [Candidatus Sericytochromatia bacterium]
MEIGPSADSDTPNEYDALVNDQVTVTGTAREMVYRTAPPQKTTGKRGSEALPDVGSTVLSTPAAQSAYRGFGVDGLKTFMLQELLKLGGRALDDEMATLISTDEPIVRRALRATKMLALQWLEDARQSQDMRLKCQALFERIPTFATGRLVEADLPAAPAADSTLPAVPPAPKRVGAVAGVALSPGDRLHIFSDLKGDIGRLKRLLKSHALVDERGEWQPGPEAYLLIVGDLINSSPIDAWGPVSEHAFAVIETLRRLSAVGHIGFSAGGTDMSIAKRTFFRHPRYGFQAPQGMPRFAQGLVLLKDFLNATAAADLQHPYAAWTLTDGFFRLKPSHQLLGLPQLELWASGEQPDVYPLVEAIERTTDFITKGAWTSQQNVNDEIPTMLPMGCDDLAYADSREALLAGLLQGTGTIEFLRTALAAQWRFRGGEEVHVVSHSGIGPAEIAQWSACKEQGWELPPLAEFLAAHPAVSKTNQARLQQSLASVGITDVAGLVAWDGETMAQRAMERRAIDSLCQTMGLRRDKTGFATGWDKWRREWQQLDAGGLAGGDLDGGQGKIEVLGTMNDQAVAAYATKIWSDLFGQPAPQTRRPDGTVLWDTGRWKGTLHIDPSVRVIRDAFGRVQLPMKHDLTLEFIG